MFKGTRSHTATRQDEDPNSNPQASPDDVDPSAEPRALQDALRAAIADCRVNVNSDVDAIGWVVELRRPGRESFGGGGAGLYVGAAHGRGTGMGSSA